MPWKVKDVERERLRFVALAEEKLYAMTELCARFGVTRQAGYDVLKRYRERGLDGLKDSSRAPKSSPQRISEEVAAVLLDVRRSHPDWGPRTILPYLAGKKLGLSLPAASTVGDLFSRAGLVPPKRRKRTWSHPGRSSITADEPNDVWTTDFKGEFRTRDRRYCYPLTIADARTRYLLACDGLSSTEHRGATAVFERIFRTFGLPRSIRSDNGGPFATKAIGGLSRLNVWWTKLGIRHDRIRRGHPEENGSHERMHLTLKRRTVYPAAADSAEQQLRFDEFRTEYNEERPHHGLGKVTPGSLYTVSTREMPACIPKPEYPGHCRIRRVRANGILYFRDRTLFLSELLIGEDVALEEIGDGVWSIYFYDLLLARLDERTFALSG
jgi:putative transposase